VAALAARAAWAAPDAGGGGGVNVLRRYLGRSMLGASALVLAVLVGLTGFIEFVHQLDDIGVGEYNLPRAIVFVVLKQTDSAFTVLPIAILLGSLLGLGSLAQSSELIAVRAAGVSLLALARAVLVTGVLLALATAVVGEYLAPPLQRYARNMRLSAMRGEAAPASESSWIRDGRLLINVNSSGEPGTAGVYLFELGAGDRLDSIAHADSAGFDAAGHWVLYNVRETRFAAGGVESSVTRSRVQPSSLSPSLLGLTVVRQDHLDGMALYRYMKFLVQNGLDARHYEVAFWGRLANIAVVPFMCVMSLCFAFGQLRRAGTGARTLTGIAIGLAYYLACQGMAEGGEVYHLDPVLAAFIPMVAVALVTGALLARAR
jgi:lipopolysaccharide export system permease protein